MSAAKHREEHANTLLARILQGLDIQAHAETTGNPNRKSPDLKIDVGGLKIILEAEYSSRRGAEKDADNRLHDKSQPDIIGALSYSEIFRSDFNGAIQTGAQLDFAFKEQSQGEGGWENRWRTGNVYDLAQLLRRPHAIVKMPHDEIGEAVQIIKTALTDFASGMETPRREKLAKLLQASLPVADKEREVAAEQSARLAGLILIGAFLFQWALADNNIACEKSKRKVPNPAEYQNIPSISTVIADWQFILNNINYAAIFRIAVSVLNDGGIGGREARRLRNAAHDVKDIARDGVDLMGVMYHELLAELAKPLGAYYTTIPAATMLSALALSPQKWDIQWTKNIRDFRMADLACGSGTLLAAACGQVRDNAMRTYMKSFLDQDAAPISSDKILKKIHRDLLENSVWGYDVLETAVHLTATTLGLIAPDVDFRKSHIYCATIGKKSSGVALAGSFQLLDSDQVNRSLFDADIDPPNKRITHVESGEETSEPLPLLDLCIMNPPFVVGRKNAPSYSFLSPNDAQAVRDKMKALANRHNFANAGLGPGFITLGEKYTKENGRMAFIMTSTLTNGRSSAWTKARKQIEKTCDLEYLVISREPGRPNFSFNTNKQECMFIARKRKKGEKPKNRAMFCVLTENPKDGSMAHATTQAILDAEKSGKECGKLQIDKRNIGEFAFLPYRNKVWNGIAFTNLHLTMAVRKMSSQKQISVYSKDHAHTPLRPLGDLAKFGSARLHRYSNSDKIEEDVRRYIEFSETPTSYAGYYPSYHKQQTGIGQKDITSISEEPNCYFTPLPDCHDWVEEYFSWCGRIVINLSFGFNASRRLASLITMPVQGSNYQPVELKNHTTERAKAMVLWLNSTPCTMIMAAYAAYCGGAKVMLSKSLLEDMPVLDINTLSTQQLKSLARAFDKIAKMKFMLIPEMNECRARKAVDSAIAQALELDDSDFATLRTELAKESIITGQ